MKFIHAGDLHLGNPFTGLAQVPNWLTNKMQEATYVALQRLVEDALMEQVDFILFPGDLFNTTTPDVRAQLVLHEAFEQLTQAKVPVIMSFGNHDFMADWQAVPQWPDNVTVLPAQIETITLTTRQNERVAISGFSYQTRHIQSNQAQHFPLRLADVDYHIGMYHGSLGDETGGNYAPFTLQDMQSKHYDYWALGHIHQRETLQEQPFIGYSGSLQGLNRNESGPKGYYLVTTEGTKVVPSFTPVAPVVWATKTLTVQGDLQQVVTQIRQQLAEQDDFKLVTLQIKTDDPVLLSLINNQQLLAQLRAQSLPMDNFYIHQVQAQQPLDAPLPALDVAYWQETAEEVFTVDNLQTLGLRHVTDAAILREFLNPERLAQIKASVTKKIQLAQMGVTDDVD